VSAIKKAPAIRTPDPLLSMSFVQKKTDQISTPVDCEQKQQRTTRPTSFLAADSAKQLARKQQRESNNHSDDSSRKQKSRDNRNRSRSGPHARV